MFVYTKISAQYTSGNLIVLTVGDSSTALSSAAAKVNLVELNKSGSVINQTRIRTTVSGANKRLTQSGSATSEGALNLSWNRRYLIFTGYDASPGTASVAGSTASANNRVVGRVDSAGNQNTTTAMTAAYSGNNIRSATSSDGTAFWTAGPSTGLGYLPLGGSTVTALNGLNSRCIQIIDNQLYCSSASGSNIGINTVGTGLPTTTGQSVNLLASAANAYAFILLDRDASISGYDLLYIADQTGGLLKYSYNGTTWTARGTYTTAGSALTGICGFYNFNTSKVEIYTTSGITTANTIRKIEDAAAYNATISASSSTIYTAPSNIILKGISFAPYSSSYNNQIYNLSGSGAVCPGTSSTNITLSGSERGVSYELYKNGITTGKILNGNGLALTFANLDSNGSYTCRANNPLTKEITNMSGTVVLSLNTHSINASAGSNGSISPNGSTSVSCGNDLLYSFFPNTNYAVDSIFVDGNYKGDSNSYSFKNIKSTHTISVKFKLNINCDTSTSIETSIGLHKSIVKKTSGNYHCFCNASGKLLLSIQSGNGGVYADTSVEINIKSKGAQLYLDGRGFVRNKKAWSAMDKTWEVYPLVQPSNPVEVRFYFTKSDLDSVRTKLQNNGFYGAYNPDSMSFYKITNNTKKRHSPIDSLQPSDIREYKNGLSPDLYTWKLGSQNSNTYYACLLTDHFSGGGGGSGASGLTPLVIENCQLKTELDRDQIVFVWNTFNQPYINLALEQLNNTEFQLVNTATYDHAKQKIYLHKSAFPNSGHSYFRLRILTNNYNIIYSNIVELNYQHSPRQIYTFQNQVNQETILFNNSNSVSTITLLNEIGKALFTIKLSPNEKKNLNYLLKPGIYFLNTESNQTPIKPIKIIIP